MKTYWTQATLAATFGLVAACSSSDANDKAAARQSLKLHASEAAAAVHCDEVKPARFEGGDYHYCAKPSAACPEVVEVCPAIEGPDSVRTCFPTCVDHVATDAACAGSVHSSTDESPEPSVHFECAPTDVPGQSAPGCAESDPDCVDEPATPAGDCSTSVLPGICGPGQGPGLPTSCCGVQTPAI